MFLRLQTFLGRKGIRQSTGSVSTGSVKRLHIPPMSPYFVPFKNGFSAFIWYCLHIPSIRLKLKMLLTKTMTLTVRVNEPYVSAPVPFQVQCEMFYIKTIQSTRPCFGPGPGDGQRD